MYCSNCGAQLTSGFNYCPQCGVAVAGAASIPKPGVPGRALFRPQYDRKIAGVCAGLAQYLSVDPTLIRVLVVCLSIWPPLVGVIFYVVCWIVIPNEPILLPAPPPADKTAVTPTESTAGI